MAFREIKYTAGVLCGMGRSIITQAPGSNVYPSSRQSLCQLLKLSQAIVVSVAVQKGWCSASIERCRLQGLYEYAVVSTLLRIALRCASER